MIAQELVLHMTDYGIRPLDPESNVINLLDNRVFLGERLRMRFYKKIQDWILKSERM